MLGLSSGVAAVSAGDSHTCALTAAGAVLCWGRNNEGQLGDATSPNKTSPVGVASTQSGSDAIATGGFHACELTSVGGVKCWGSNSNGQLGNGTTSDSPTPADVTGLTSGVSEIATGGLHSCALTTSGGVKCWGWNFWGQVGIGTVKDVSVPSDVTGLTSGVQAIALGGHHSCALLTSGGVKCWGQNFGDLGDGTTAKRLVPVDVIGLTTGAAAITAGISHTCAITTAGGAQCWGRNNYGQLGIGTSATRLTPAPVVGLDTGVAAIAGGGNHTCAVMTGGGVACWGWNLYGQLGNGTTKKALVPGAVTGLGSGVAAIATGFMHSCALLSSGSVMCWGNNSYGQVGDGTTADRMTPVQVS